LVQVEILDKTGSVGIFDDEQTQIEPGKTYLILASDNRILSAVPAEDITKMDTALTKYLNYRQLPYKDDELYVVSFKPRVTKAGKKMAYLTVACRQRATLYYCIPNSIRKGLHENQRRKRLYVFSR
jgi:hypothetical protein